MTFGVDTFKPFKTKNTCNSKLPHPCAISATCTVIFDDFMQT